MKDLSSFGYPLERLVLVDNFISASAMQIENGIPILPYYEGKEDNQLVKLAQFVKQKLLVAADVRKVLRDTFQTQIFHENTALKDLVVKLQENFKIQKKG